MNVKKVLKVLLVIFGIAVVGCVGLFLYDNCMPVRTKKENVEFCECLKEYKKDIKCSKYGFVSNQSAIDFYKERSDLFLIAMQNPSATVKKKYDEMNLQWDLCQMRVSDCFICDNKTKKDDVIK